MKDWQGREIDVEEPDDKIVRAWSVSPHIDESFDSCVVRSWQDMLDAVRTAAEYHLEALEDDDLPFEIEVQIVGARVGDLKGTDGDGIETFKAPPR